MSNTNIIYVTNRYDESISRLKEICNSSRVNVKLENNHEFFCDGDFAFGYYQTDNGFDAEFLDLGKLSNKALRIVRSIKRELRWREDSSIIFAVHWGGREKVKYQELISQINSAISKDNVFRNIRVSYWGSVSDSFQSNSLEKIKSEIIEFPYGNNTELFGILEIVQIQNKTISALIENTTKEDRLKFINDNNEIVDKLQLEITNLRDVLIELKNVR